MSPNQLPVHSVDCPEISTPIREISDAIDDGRSADTSPPVVNVHFGSSVGTVLDENYDRLDDVLADMESHKEGEPR